MQGRWSEQIRWISCKRSGTTGETEGRSTGLFKMCRYGLQKSWRSELYLSQCPSGHGCFRSNLHRFRHAESCFVQTTRTTKKLWNMQCSFAHGSGKYVTRCQQTVLVFSVLTTSQLECARMRVYGLQWPSRRSCRHCSGNGLMTKRARSRPEFCSTVSCPIPSRSSLDPYPVIYGGKQYRWQILIFYHRYYSSS